MTDRRQILTVAAGAAALALLPLGALAQAADTAAATADTAAPATSNKTPDEIIAEFTGGAEVTDGGVTLTAPEIAENGNTVPISVAAPGAEAILVIASGNPAPEAATFRFGPLAGSQEASTRIRLAQTQDVLAIAKLPDGTFGRTSANIKVTIGGCGG